ncbi:SWIM zinc finger family protein [Streptomyces sp. NPDC058467]|uniref:SWIM zinc finger family protein n=1 Tax=Streptomyces sp. NPDC058467 TaxID=3346513 RepID=UPI0036492FE2
MASTGQVSAGPGASGSAPVDSGSPGSAPTGSAGSASAGTAPTVRPSGGAAGGARPGDVAREALRAARSEAARARTDAETKGVGAARRSADPTAPRAQPRRSSPDQGRGARARDVRDLLAGAFELPTEATPLGGASEDERAARPGAETGRRRGALLGERGRETAGDSRPGRTEDAGQVAPEPQAPEAQAPDSQVPHVPALDAQALNSQAPNSQAPNSQALNPQAPDVRAPDPRPGPFGRVRDAASGSRPVPPETTGPSAPPGGRVARSMAAPGRDGELRRTFAALPTRELGADAFAETWWGNAWVTALEEGALDAARLARGRAYAGHGYVDAITVTPGSVLAYVHGSRPRPYRVQVRVRTLSDGDWDRFLDAAAERPGHIAALLDKEMPKSLAECGIELLPGPGELEPHCSCPDSGHPCKHAAALCYQTARLLDEDPFVLLLLRGRGERELLDALSRRNAARAARAAQEQEPAPLPGVRARDVLARRALPFLPAPLPAPAHPEQPPTYPGAPGGPDPFALDQLATDAAARAHALLTTGRDPVAELTLWQDAVRLAAARPGSGLTAATRALYSSLASATGRTPADLARAVAAWRQGGFEALRVLEEPWDPPAGRFDRARPLLLAADLPAFRPWRNQLTHPRGHAQLRLGQNGLWYAYESEPGHDDWWPRGTPDLDPVGALTGLGAPGDL